MGTGTSRGSDKDILLAGFEAARLWSGLLVTLAAGAIVFTATFAENFVPEGQPLKNVANLDLLEAGWIVLGVSVIVGVLLLGTLTASLNKGSADALDVYAPMTRLLAVSQILTFICGGILLMVFFVKVVS